MSEINNNNETSHPSAPAPFPNITAAFINSLTEYQKRLFYKVMRREFDKILPAKSFTSMGGLLSCYWMVETIRKRLKLRSSQLSFLTLLYYATNQGKTTTSLNSLLPFSSDSRSFIDNNMKYLYERSYIRRDPFHSGSFKRPEGQTGKYIRLTLDGRDLINKMHTELRHMIYKTHIKIEEPPIT